MGGERCPSLTLSPRAQTNASHPASMERAGGMGADRRPTLVWDPQGEQGLCPHGCLGYRSTFRSPALHPPVPHRGLMSPA